MDPLSQENLHRSDLAYWSPSSPIRQLEAKALREEPFSAEELLELQKFAAEVTQPLSQRLAHILLDPDMEDPQAACFRRDRLATRLERLLQDADR